MYCTLRVCAKKRLVGTVPVNEVFLYIYRYAYAVHYTCRSRPGIPCSHDLPSRSPLSTPRNVYGPAGLAYTPTAAFRKIFLCFNFRDSLDILYFTYIVLKVLQIYVYHEKVFNSKYENIRRNHLPRTEVAFSSSCGRSHREIPENARDHATMFVQRST